MDVLLKYNKVYATDQVLVTMGGDFHYENATKWFHNLDNLIKFVNRVIFIFYLQLDFFFALPFVDAVKQE